MRNLTRPKFGSMLIVVVLLAFVVPLALFSSRAHQTDAASPPHHARPMTGTPIDWPEFHADAARDGMQDNDTQLNKTNANTLAPITGAAYTTTGSVNSSPAIVGGILYYAANLTNTPDASTMYAVSVATGQVVWSVPFPVCGAMPQTSFVLSSPAVGSGYISALGSTQTEVFIGRGSRNKGGIGCVYDFDGATGALIWNYVTPGTVYASPAIMSTNGGTIVVTGDNSDYVHAFSVDYAGALGGTGVQLWQYNTRYDPPPPGSSQYCQKNEELCGDAVWSSPAEALVMVNGTAHHYAYFGVGAEDNTVGRVDAIDMDALSTAAHSGPTLAWAFWDPHPQFNDDFGTILALTDSNGFGIRIYSGMNNGDMYALDPATGAMFFDFSTSAQLGGVKSVIHSTGSLVVINGVTELIFGAGSKTGGYIFAIDALSTASGGTFLWQSQNFGGEMMASPAVVNQGTNAVVYTMGSVRLGTPMVGDLLAIDPTNGAIVADYPVYNHAYGSDSSPAVYGNMVFVTEGDNIYNNPNPGKGGLAAFQCASC
ncbi:MAG TPA: PQQ-binding-like beta-propeller repeat protein [Ktedonobacteraceae bacterium]|nr:PQQ-binding-like beta-propeller repeat protein [Ktedonobacteraceae bacterium]